MLMTSLLKAPFQLSLTYFLSLIEEHGNHCNTVESGFQCKTSIARFWGQYSPYFAVEDDIPDRVPCGCNITFAQALVRHGARDPTTHKTTWYNRTIHDLQANLTTPPAGVYSFLADYSYDLGAEDLTAFGEDELFDAGVQFARRYQELTLSNEPFLRSSSIGRVVRSAEKWLHGYQQETEKGNDVSILIVSEGSDSNNTLDHGLCTSFENGWIARIRDEAQAQFSQSFVPTIQQRLKSGLPGVELAPLQVISLMDLCAYETVASPGASIVSPFCHLFSEDEWHAYNYYTSLEKYYGRGAGNPLGPTQGVGFVNELLARLTQSPVIDETSSNHTLNGDPATFPLDRKLYADFSHDNSMVSVLFALGLYNHTVPLSNHTLIEPDSEEAQGFSASWTVPFAARIYFEKMRCNDDPEEWVRVVVNGRVVPLVGCNADLRGMCTLKKFVESQHFARAGGRWHECFS